MNLFTTSNAM